MPNHITNIVTASPKVIASDDEFYVCQSCGYEERANWLSNYCPHCIAALDELEPIDG